LSYLRRHFNVVPLRDLVSRLRSGMDPEPYSVAVTVDDAYADFGTLAYPVFLRHGVRVTVYVVSESGSGRIWLWWDAIRYVLARASDGEYHSFGPEGLVPVRLSDAASREEAWNRLAGIGLALSPGKRDEYLQGIQKSF